MKSVVTAVFAAGLANQLLPAFAPSTVDIRGTLNRAGMVLAQSSAPKEDEPGAAADRGLQGPPREPAPKTSPPANDEGNSGAAPPSDAAPPGCIFNKGPLELIV
jgi:hypothetical protein